MGITGWSVTIDVFIPFLAKTPGVFGVRFLSSGFDLSDKNGPEKTFVFSFFSSSAIKWPSEQCIIT